MILENGREVLREIKVCPQGVGKGGERRGSGWGVLLEDGGEEATCGKDGRRSLWEDGGGGWLDRVEGVLLECTAE